MNKRFNPHACAQAALVFNQLLLDIVGGDEEALARFNADPQSDERLAVTKLFEVNLLELVGTKVLSAIDRFDSAEHFCDGNSHGIKFYFGENFEKSFIGKVEVAVAARKIKSYALQKGLSYANIRKQIGSATGEVSLGQLFQLLKAQSKGEEGFLITNRWENLFCISDKHGKLWVVLARWADDGWVVGAYPLEDGRWSAGIQVLF